MSFVYERIVQSLAANEVLRVAIAAGELRIAAADYPVTVRLLQGGRVLGSGAGMLAGDYVRGVPFDSFEVINGGNPQNVVIKLASGQSGSDRIVGEVSVISGEIARVRAGVAFCASAFSPAVAAQYSYVQLWNSLTSGKRLIVNQCLTAVSGSAVAVLAWNAAALGGVAAFLPGNKLSGGVASIAEIRTGVAGAMVSPSFTGWAGASKVSFVMPINEPLVIMPGNGLIVQAAAVNEEVRCAFQYWEESI